MTVKEKVIIARIVESIRKKPEYAEHIGISVKNLKTQYLKEEGKTNE